MDDVQKLILQVQGREEVDTLRKAVESEEDALRKLIATHDAHDTAVRASAQRTLELQARLAAAEQTMRSTGTGIKGMSQAAIEFSRGMEDLATGGALGILNNIPRTFEGIGQAAGLSAAQIAGLSTGISLVATGAFVLYRNWDQAMALFGKKTTEAIDGIDRLKKEIKELEDKPVKLAVDTLRIEQARDELKELEAAKRAFDAAGEGKTVEEKAAGDQFRQEFEATGQRGKEARDKLRADMANELVATSKTVAEAEKMEAEAQKAIDIADALSARAQSASEAAGAASMRRAAQNELAAAREAASQARLAITKPGGEAERKIGELFAGAFAGNDATARAELARRFQQSGEGGFAGLTEEFTPEEMQRRAGLGADFERQVEQNEAQRKRAEAEAAAIDADNARQSAAGMRGLQAADKTREAQTAKRIGEQIKQENAAIQGGGYVPLAEREMARMGAQGGDTDRFGRFHQMTPAQIQNEVRRRVEMELQRRNPRMGADQRGDLANVITADATADLQKRMLSMNATGMNSTQKLLAVTGQLDSEVAQLQKQVMSLAAGVDRQFKRTQARARTAQKRGS